MNKTTPTAPPAQANDGADRLKPILDALRGLRFGSVTVIVQDGVIVQVERIEKRRLGRTVSLDAVE